MSALSSPHRAALAECTIVPPRPVQERLSIFNGADGPDPLPDQAIFSMSAARENTVWYVRFERAKMLAQE